MADPYIIINLGERIACVKLSYSTYKKFLHKFCITELCSFIYSAVIPGFLKIPNNALNGKML